MIRHYLYITVITLFVALLTSCSKSGKRESEVQNFINVTDNDALSATERKVNHSGRSTVVRMEKVNGVNQIPVEVNGVEMYFIFDTGASIISISETEALFLYKQGSLRKEDILGTAEFSDANGEISEGTIINLNTIKIGSQTLTNVKASVVHNSIAPLLFGQSALEKFGRISIDNKRQELTFEY
jgi:aspartyl protease family protein